MSDSKFAHLAKHSVTTEPRKFTLSYGGDAVTLHCIVAGEANKPWWNDAVRSSAARTAGGGGKAPGASAKAARLKDAEAFAKHCVVGWDEDANDPAQNPLRDSEGEVVPYSKEAAHDFLTALAAHVPYAFDEFRFWLINDRNFTDREDDGGITLGN